MNVKFIKKCLSLYIWSSDSSADKDSGHVRCEAVSIWCQTPEDQNVFTTKCHISIVKNNYFITEKLVDNLKD